MAKSSKSTKSTTTSSSSRRSRQNRNQVRQEVRPSRLRSLLSEVSWVLYAIMAVALCVMLFTWHSNDPGWLSTSHHATVKNKLGVLGAYTSDIILYLLGLSSWWLVVFCVRRLYVGYKRMMQRIMEAEQGVSRVKYEEAFGFIILMLGSIGLEAIQFTDSSLTLPGQAGGVLGLAFADYLKAFIGNQAALIALVCMVLFGLSLFLNFSWLGFFEKIGAFITHLLNSLFSFFSARKDRRLGEKAQEAREVYLESHKEQNAEHKPLKIEPAIKDFPVSDKAEDAKQSKLFKSAPVAEHKTKKEKNTLAKTQLKVASNQASLPDIELLDPAPEYIESVAEDTIEFNSRLIEKKLGDFNVQVQVDAAQAGPVITRYEIEPASGVKGSQIVNLSKDLARALSLVRIRVVETIPGKNLMGIELPNPRRQMVRLSEIIGSQVYQDNSSDLTLALGKDIAGHPIVADLAKMPHLLVAGTTGSGKSVGINAMILSILYKTDPSQVRMILIDPKMLEMSIYEGIGHLLAPVVTDMKQAANALNWCVGEMEKRYKLMSKMGVRNVAGYNRKIQEAEKKDEPIPNPFSLTPDQPEPLTVLPKIVVIIDELADLMMVAGKKIEELIARLAQKARAAGIHLILATQRPSVDVITGLIKANIPTRIAFQVSSKVDSRTILDQMGAESLLGQGDMLYLPPGAGVPQRVHGAFVSDEEVQRVVDFLKEQGEADYVDGVLEGAVQGETGDGVGSVTGFTDDESDPLYDQAVEIVIKSRKASISYVQRQLRIGYNRAARLLEQMEKSGLVSPMQSNNSREVLIPAENTITEED